MKLLEKITGLVTRLPILFASAYMFERVRLTSQFYREEFFSNCMRFIAFNHVEGDYLEFGVGKTTFSLAYKHSRLQGLKMHFCGFDSFSGLPKPKGIDVHPAWVEGEYRINVEDFKKFLRRLGLQDSDYTLVAGFYDESLTDNTLKKLNLKKAALIYVDCDLYESTVSVLRFVFPLLHTGTIIAFDDWYTFNGDPERGEQLALKEFLQQNPEVKLTEYLGFEWCGKSFIVKKD
jgi:O-methyltransferase